MAAPYRRRKPALIRNAWVYRHVILAAALLGLTAWFCWSNRAAVTVVLPFGLGKIESFLGLVILLSALAGSGVTILLLGVIYAFRRLRSAGEAAELDDTGGVLAEDRPPSDYASKTPEGFSQAPWSKDL